MRYLCNEEVLAGWPAGEEIFYFIVIRSLKVNSPILYKEPTRYNFGSIVY